jgi:hypothetical protein
MSGSEDVYTSTMLERFGYLATWYPGTQLGLGLIGVLEGKTFVPKSSIRTLGVRFATTRDPSTDKKLQFKSSKSIQLHTKLKGSVTNIAPSIPKARAGVAVSFGKETGVVFSASGLGATRIADVLALEDAIWDLWDRFLWDESWIVVTELLSAKKTTILVSEGGESKVELQASGSAKAGPIDVGDLTVGFKVVSSSGMHTQIVGESGMTPLFRAIRVRKSFWQRTRIEAARAPGPPPAPGRVARRGRTRPRAKMTEIVKD